MLQSKEQVAWAVETVEAVKQEIGRVIVGQNEIVEQLLWAIIAGGHALLEGIPGLGKTMLVRTIADTLDLEFSRIQFTPDLMPSDITGTNLVEFGTQGQTSYRFQPGPIFGNIVLADEINRATPKTQSALLEAMQEKTVTAAGETHLLPKPFFVLATQNPLEQEGTYPLPEAQLDRFLLKLDVAFPTREELKLIVQRTTAATGESANRMLSSADLGKLQAYAKEVLVADEILDLAVKLLMMTHPDEADSPDPVKQFVRYGGGPRAIQSIIAASKVRALTSGRLHVSWQDIRSTAIPALRHRIVLGYEGQSMGMRTDTIVGSILDLLELQR
ncbi:hypothetical protein PAECIP111893_00910 [Paenibacillus plantiphilus]|uniref:AAA family ATPase n=1 Tax=Paenibacillus plantiphilus TaxID=2905650 RepID=A0ABM9BYB2_9BACL|nr:AAA family ATPase [Paenibacillus plantiphilus]CAH1197720.1 hypothetical protein PAECIP111893_00910 [Paenibacillus plantiphilus]